MREDDYRDYDESDDAGCGAVTAAIVLITLGLIFLAAWLCTGCTTTKYVPVETVRTEYEDKVREVHTTDSVTDTRFVYVNGDTVVDWRDRVRWREKIVHDSIYIERTDSVAVPYPVERELTRWEQTKMDFGGMAMGGLLIAVAIAVVWLARRFRR